MAEAWAVILAAGLGTRMRSERPKVLHPVGGRPMIQKVQSVLREAGFDQQVVVVGHRGEEVAQAAQAVPGVTVRIAHQPQQRGTADAVAHGLQALASLAEGQVLVAYGDTLCSEPERWQNSPARTGGPARSAPC